ncbi:MAG: CPBP family intramembrane metalloprotease [Bacteroides sp.]|nr:CPBP family intramembrane metalloprotease [Bacteroides sp.]
MRTSIKLVLLYFLMQFLAAIAAAPIGIAYTYITSGKLDPVAAQDVILPLAMLLGFLFMGIYLWKKGYLKNDGLLYSWKPASVTLWALLAGVCCIVLIDFIMSFVKLPDLMENTFDILQSGWAGILSIALLGPILEEYLFRGAITKELLKRYTPTKAILFSGLIFGVFHLNPPQIVAACFSGFLFAWLYWRTRSLIPGILIHILNNSLSTYLSVSYPELKDATTTDLIGLPAQLALTAVALLLFLLAIKKIKAGTRPVATCPSDDTTSVQP